METLKDVTIQIFKGKFIAFYTVLVTVIAFVFLYKLAFTPQDELNEHVGVIIGFLISTAITVPITFWFKHGGKEGEPENIPANNE